MIKKKAIICTILFAIILIGSYIGTIFIKSNFGFSLYEIVTPSICSFWIAERIKKFYYWLIEKEI